MLHAIVEVPAAHHSSKRNKGIVGGTEAVAAAALLAKGSEAQCQLEGMEARICNRSSLDPLPRCGGDMAVCVSVCGDVSIEAKGGVGSAVCRVEDVS